MSYCNKALEAIEKTLHEYITNTHVFRHSYCALCIIYYRKDPYYSAITKTYCRNSSCSGCPLASISGAVGCCLFSSYEQAANFTQFKKRIAFYKRLLIRAKKTDPKLFTPTGWKFWEWDYTE